MARTNKISEVAQLPGEGETSPANGLTAPRGGVAPKKPRSRASAKAAGSKFERDIADYLAATVDDRIDRRVKTGAKDRGDIGGVRVHGQKLVLECKNTARINLGGWISEAHTEAGNDDALAGVIVHKRHGVGDPAQQWVTMTVADLVALMTGEPQPGRYE